MKIFHLFCLLVPPWVNLFRFPRFIPFMKGCPRAMDVELGRFVLLAQLPVFIYYESLCLHVFVYYFICLRFVFFF
jgi:hypothetical protein